MQRVQPAVEPGWEARSEGEALSALGAALGLEGFDGRYDAREVSKALATQGPAFAGCDFESVGAGGAANAPEIVTMTVSIARSEFV